MCALRVDIIFPNAYLNYLRPPAYGTVMNHPGSTFFRATHLYRIQTLLRHGTLMTRPRDLLTVETRSWVSKDWDTRIL